MSGRNPTDEQSRYYESPPRQLGAYQYQHLPGMAHAQQPAHQPDYPSRSQLNNPFYFLPPTAPSTFSASGYPINMSQPDYTSCHTQQTYPQPTAVPQYPPNPSEYNNTNYHHQPLAIPNYPPPAYDAILNPEEDPLEKVAPINSEQIHDAETFVDQETLGWIPLPKNNHQQMRRLEFRPCHPYRTTS